MQDIHKVMVFGTFDFFHEGHVNFLKQAREFGNYLIIVVAQDETVIKIKGEPPVNSLTKRIQRIVSSKLANQVVAGYLEDRFKIIHEHRPDKICLGYDQRVDEFLLQKQLINHGLSIVIHRLKAYYPNRYKSSIIKHNLKINQQTYGADNS